MPDYDKIAGQFGGAPDAGQVPDRYDLAAQKFSGSAGAAAPVAPAAKPVGAVDRVRAAAAGVNKGFFSDLLGLPVDTIENVLDLGRAGIGTIATAAGHPDLAPDIPDRASIAGSSAWIARKLNDVGMGGAINNPNPQDGTSRVLYSGGRVAGASVVPSPKVPVSLAQNLANMTKGAISGTIGGAVGEVAPDWAGVAGMLPQAGTAVGAAAFRQGLRGGEAGRIAMNQRLQDLREGGIDAPSVGLATGNRNVMGLENLLAQTPGSIGLYEKAGQANLAGMQSKVDALRDSLSTDFGPVAAGSAIQGDLKGSFRDRINGTTRTLNDQVAANVGPGFYTFPENALGTAGSMSAINPAAPATSQALQNKRIAGIADDLASDVQGTPIPGDPLMNAPTRYLRADGQLLDAPPGIPFATLKNLRTSIGEEANSPAILGTPEGAQFKRLYGAMSQDMRQGVGAADRQNAGVDVGPLLPSQQPATLALNRANTFYSRAATRAEDLNGIANRDTPEGAYGAVTNSLNNGPSLYEKLRGTLDPATRQKLVATVVDQLGTAKPGQQTADGDVWSPRTFLTNYSKLYQNGGGDALFKRLPGGQQQADQLASIAKTAEMLGDSSKVWANPSGTAPAMTARGTVYALTVGAFFHPIAAVGTAAGLGVANQVSQRLLLNPKFVNWLAKAPSVSPAQTQAYAQRLLANAKLSGDKQFQQDAATYLQAVQQQIMSYMPSSEQVPPDQ